MKKQGPFLIVEDDLDDQEIMRTVLEGLGVTNELVFFDKASPVLSWLAETETQPFIILCDVNLPRMSGIELRNRICEDEFIKKKSIPFIFFTTSASRKDVDEAYDKSVQGYFEKPTSISGMHKMLETIIRFWDLCIHPNSYH